jgi:hypothetical protein
MPFVYLFILFSVTLAASPRAELENLLFQVRNSRALDIEDKTLLEQTLEKARKGIELSSLEDTLVYHVIEKINETALKFVSPVNRGWVIYKRFNGRGYALVVEFPGTEGLIQELVELDDKEEIPYFVWDVSHLSFYLETGEVPRRDLVKFSPEAGTLLTMVESPYDDFSPVPSPDGRWLAFLSTRDRLDPLDSGASLYIKQTTKRGGLHKLSKQADLLGNDHSHPSRILFKDKDTLELKSKAGMQSFHIPSLLAQVRESESSLASAMSRGGESLGTAPVKMEAKSVQITYLAKETTPKTKTMEKGVQRGKDGVIIREPTYNAPYQIPLEELIKKPSTPPPVLKSQRKFWLEEEIEREILAFPDHIQSIASRGQMQELIVHFNHLHSQVALRLAKWAQSQDYAKRRKSSRWKSQINGIRELINGAKILFEEE